VERSTDLPYDSGSFDVAFAVCVLHHVDPAARRQFTAELARVTRPGGLTVVFEHNPFNPLTRLAVARCEFDEGVELLRRRELQRLLAPALREVESRYLLFVPWRAERLERALGGVPLGAQYYVASTR
jgi:SAM-dependent methyltransferase